MQFLLKSSSFSTTIPFNEKSGTWAAQGYTESLCQAIWVSAESQKEPETELFDYPISAMAFD